IGSVGTVRIQQPICQRIGGTQGSAIPGERLQIFLESQQGESTRAGTPEFHGCGNGLFKQAPRGSAQSRLPGSAENGSQPPQGPPMTVFRANRLLPLAFVAQTISEPFGGGIESVPQEGQIPRGQVGRACGRANTEIFQQG